MFLIPENNPKDVFIATSIKDSFINVSSIDESKRYEYEKAFFEDIDIDMKKSIFMKQIHGSNILKIDKSNFNIYSKMDPVLDTDALITNLENIPLVVQTADCLPLVLYSKDTRSMAAIHAGWRGVVSKIIPKTISVMIDEYNSDPFFIYAYIGAHIFEENYEVGKEVADMFESKSFISGHWHVDIAKEARRQMIESGVLEKNIEVSKLNSYDKRFYSYRRDGKQIGRILTLGVIK